MLGQEAMGLMDFTTSSLYKRGKYVDEFMSSTGQELMGLQTRWATVDIQVNGYCQFFYKGEEFTTREDLEGRDDVVELMREHNLHFDHNPWLETVISDTVGDVLESDSIEYYELPTELEAKAWLIREMRKFGESHGGSFDKEGHEFLKALANFQCWTVKLPVKVHAQQAVQEIDAFFINNPDLLNVVGAIETWAGEDEYGGKSLTLFCHTTSEPAKELMMDMIRKYGQLTYRSTLI